MATPDPEALAARREAVALTYSPGESAPRVVAKGRGLVAQEILARAREAGIYVHESPDLVALLMQVDLDRHIPPQLLAWIYRLEQGAAAGPPPAPTAGS